MKAAGILGIAGGVITFINPPVGALVLTAAAVTWVATSDDDKPSECPEPKVVPRLNPPPLDFSSLGIPEVILPPSVIPQRFDPLPDFPSLLTRHDEGIGKSIANQWLTQPGSTSHLDVEITHEWLLDGNVIKTATSRHSFDR